MNISITGRKISIKDRFEDRVQKKLSKLDKFFGTEADAQVTLTYLKDQFTVEITIRDTKTSMVYRAERTTDDMFDSLEAAADTIVRQIVKNRRKLEQRVREDAFREADFALPEEGPEEIHRVVRTKKFSIKPMEVEEAILQMDMLGHTFFMFRNVETDQVSLVYRRKDGDYGLMEPEE